MEIVQDYLDSILLISDLGYPYKISKNLLVAKIVLGILGNCLIRGLTVIFVWNSTSGSAVLSPNIMMECMIFIQCSQYTLCVLQHQYIHVGVFIRAFVAIDSN